MSIQPSLADRLRTFIHDWARSQFRIVSMAADFADSAEWAAESAPTAAHWLADVADIEVSTAREWIRVGRRLRELPASADAFARRAVSYAKIRTLTRIATPESERELLDMAGTVAAGQLGRALAAWVAATSNPEELARHHQRSRSVRRRIEPDGMVGYTMQLPPLVAGHLDARLQNWVMRGRSRPDASADAPPSIAQQHADAVADLVAGGGAGGTDVEVILHVRGDGVTLDDGTPVPRCEAARLVPTALIRTLIHDAEANPIGVSHRRRHPDARQRRFVKARDQHCRDCGSTHLLQYDHNPAYEQTGHTTTDELELRCGPCHRKRHAREAA